MINPTLLKMCKNDRYLIAVSSVYVFEKNSHKANSRITIKDQIKWIDTSSEKVLDSFWSFPLALAISLIPYIGMPKEPKTINVTDREMAKLVIPMPSGPSTLATYGNVTMGTKILVSPNSAL